MIYIPLGSLAASSQPALRDPALPCKRFNPQILCDTNVSQAPGHVWDGGRSTALPLSVSPRAQLRDVPALKTGRD